MDTPNVLIAVICSHDSVPTAFAISLANIEKPLNYHVEAFSGYSVDMMRNRAAVMFLKPREDHPPFTHLFMLDTDMLYPRDSLLKLYRHNKDVIAGLSSAKWFFNQDKLQKAEIYSYDSIEPTGDPYAVKSTGKFHNTGCHRVYALPGAGVLIKRRVMESMPMPPFKFDFISPTGIHCGEDIYFSVTARTRGFELWQDYDLRYTHIAQVGLTPETDTNGIWSVTHRHLRS